MHTKIHVFTWYVGMYVIVKVLAILTRWLFSLAFSEISPEADAKTANYTKFDIKQMENGEILWMVKTISTFSAE